MGKRRSSDPVADRDNCEVWVIRNPSKLPLADLEESLTQLLDDDSVDINMNDCLYESTKHEGPGSRLPQLFIPAAPDRVKAASVPVMGLISIAQKIAIPPRCRLQSTTTAGPPELRGEVRQRFKPFGASPMQKSPRRAKKRADN